MRFQFSALRLLLFPLALLFLGLVACGTEASPILKVGGIPDQDTSRLARRYEIFVAYLTEELGVEVRYLPSVDYAAVVTAFGQDELQVAFFGGLTGVQARLQNPGARAIAQRENDAQFHTKFIARADLDVSSLEDVRSQARDLTITFGSESSTSGHLMPRYYLTQAGIDPDADFRSVSSFSGSHDKTWQLVQSGSFDIGALNEDVWNRAVRQGRVDASKVKEFWTTPAYFDYNWTVRSDLDANYGEDFTNKLQAALLKLNPQEHGDILELFSAEGFIESDNSNYQAIEAVGRGLELIR